MSPYRLKLSFRARQDAHGIYEWLAQHSFPGATAWFDEFLGTLDKLHADPLRLPQAPEAEDLGIDLREIAFKTRKGNTYRILFLVTEDTIQIAAIRGTGQDLATLNDLEIT